jgi:adenylate kinase
MIILFFGPPGVGKTTQAQLLKGELKIPFYSLGEILRNKIKSQDLPLEYANSLQQGHLLPDKYINKLACELIINHPKGVILDGYPRTLEQGKALVSFLTKNSAYQKVIIV